MSSAEQSAQSAARCRVVVLDHTGQLGGAELALARLAGWVASEVELVVVLFADGPLRTLLEDRGVTVEVLPLDRDIAELDRVATARLSPATLARALRLVTFSWRLARRLRQLRPDVVHATSLKADLLSIVPARVSGAALVWYVHDRIADDYLPTTLVRLVRWASRLPDELIVNSTATGATLPRTATLAYPGFAPEQVGSCRARTGSDRPVVGLIGRVAPTKGQLEFVRAARIVLDRIPEARFRLIGAPVFGAEAYAEQVRAEARALAVEDRLTWVGFVDDTAPELDELAVCVHASPVPEPFGQVVVEAMIRGVPVVATRAGGVTEILARPDGDLGVLVPPGDVSALAAAVLTVLDDPVSAARRAERARRDVLARFGVDRTAEVVTEAWRRAARRRRVRLRRG